MRKVCVSMLVLLLAFGTECYGAVSDDIYVRKDVFEVYTQSVNSKLDMILEQMREQREEQKAQREEMNAQLKAQREEMKEQVKELKDEMGTIREEQKAQREEMNAQVKELKDEMQTIRDEQQSIRKDIAELVSVVSVMSEHIDGNFDTLSARIDGLDKRMDNQQNYLYLVLVIMGIIVALPTVQKALQIWEDRKYARSSFTTLEDVKRLIEESNLNFSGKPQV